MLVGLEQVRVVEGGNHFVIDLLLPAQPRTTSFRELPSHRALSLDPLFFLFRQPSFTLLMANHSICYHQEGHHAVDRS